MKYLKTFEALFKNLLTSKKLDEISGDRTVYSIEETFENFDENLFNSMSDERDQCKIGDWVIADYWMGDFAIFKITEEIDNGVGGDIGTSGEQTFYGLETADKVVKYDHYVSKLVGERTMKKISSSPIKENFGGKLVTSKELDTGGDHRIWQTNMVFDNFDEDLFRTMPDQREVCDVGDWVIIEYANSISPFILKVNDKDDNTLLGAAYGGVYHSIESAEHVVKYDSYISEIVGKRALRKINQNPIR